MQMEASTAKGAVYLRLRIMLVFVMHLTRHV